MLSLRMQMKHVLASLLPDLCALAGAGLAVYGSWLVYQPLGFVVAGGALLFVGISARGVRT